MTVSTLKSPASSALLLVLLVLLGCGETGATASSDAAGLDGAAPSDATGAIERWGLFELTLAGPSTGNPYVDVQWAAVFTQGMQSITVPGFWDGASTYKLRFSPPTTGTWAYQTTSTVPALNGKTGSLQVTDATGDNHGPVQVVDTFYLHYADGTRYHQWGTTSYAWVHQTDAIQQQTLQTLSTAPFNKLRMTVFPKDYVYNKNDPPYYAFVEQPGYPQGCTTTPVGTVCAAYNFDFTQIDLVFWQHFEQRVQDLLNLGIQADIILFHPYDRWGFSNMGADDDDRYVRYCIARFSAYRNVWWSLANEWQINTYKTVADWDRFGGILMNEDPNHRMCSIHGTDACSTAQFDYKKPYLTHAGIQSSCEDSGPTYRNEWQKPIIFDESRYEGNILWGFGNLTPLEMSERFWTATFVGTYQGHGECYEDPLDVLWWSKGNVLKGQSPARIQWFANVMAQAPEFDELVPQGGGDMLILAQEGAYYMVYCRDTTPKTISLAGAGSYKVELLDPWAMTVTSLGTASAGSYNFTPPPSAAPEAGGDNAADWIYRFTPAN